MTPPTPLSHAVNCHLKWVRLHTIVKSPCNASVR